ncbi:MAG: phosphoribosylglycinamide formyltransferase [Marinilabiliales bacterium]|nr:phosphoribosylglycinamide formyltransferase [Marinilabiliales bacterium]
MKKIAILASGSGTNAENIIRYFQGHPEVCIDSVWSNKPEAFVLKRALGLGVESRSFSRREFSETDLLLEEFQSRSIDLIVLAGFLLLVPPKYVRAFTVVNIHPALLPAYGGKGMYGEHVHQAVVAAGEKQSGITIHLVDEEYDHGRILFQATCEVLPGDTPEILAGKIHRLEMEHFPAVIGKLLAEQTL